MIPQWQVSRTGVLWLLISVIAAIAGLAPFLPPWVPVVGIVALGWRVGIYRGKWGAPGKTLKLSLLLVCIAGLFASYQRIYGLEPMVSMLVCAYALKLLEIHSRRDALVVIYLGFFVVITLALFNQSMVAALYAVFALVLVTAALAGIHSSQEHSRPYQPLSTAAKVLVQAVPLMVVFFLVMPRLGPLWAVPSAGSAVTGMSDRLSLGDISDLGQSSEIAFRVTFDGPVPKRDQLYWRGLTLSGFDGKTWEVANWGYHGESVQWYRQQAAWWREQVNLKGNPYSYRVTLERHKGNWLYGLWASRPASEGVGVSRYLTLVADRPVVRRMQYSADAWLQASLDIGGLSPLRERIETRLPSGFNPRTEALARRWRFEAANADDVVERALALFNREFFYTLRPRPLGRDSVDEFLFDTKEGFCEHFAASFVYLMRAAHIPARLVVGYQGGEYHPEQGYLIVRQYDAHAWAEVWLEGRGWTRVDPTAAVAPERIRDGMLGTLGAEDLFAESPFSMGRFQHIPWMNRLRMTLDSLEYHWATWILGYENIQSDLLQKLLGGLDFRRILLFVLVGSAIGLLPVMALIFWPGRNASINALDTLYLRFCRKLSKAGCPRNTGESPRSFALRSSDRFPECKDQILAITEEYERLRYSPSGGDARALRQRIRQLRVRRG